MKDETRYAYEKRIKELEASLEKAEDARWSYKCALQAVYEGCVEVTAKGNTGLSVSWVLSKMKGVWK